MVEEKRSFKKLAIFFRVSRRGRRVGGLLCDTLRYILWKVQEEPKVPFTNYKGESSAIRH